MRRSLVDFINGNGVSESEVTRDLEEKKGKKGKKAKAKTKAKLEPEPEVDESKRVSDAEPEPETVSESELESVDDVIAYYDYANSAEFKSDIRAAITGREVHQDLLNLLSFMYAKNNFVRTYLEKVVSEQMAEQKAADQKVIEEKLHLKVIYFKPDPKNQKQEIQVKEELVQKAREAGLIEDMRWHELVAWCDKNGYYVRDASSDEISRFPIEGIE